MFYGPPSKNGTFEDLVKIPSSKKQLRFFVGFFIVYSLKRSQNNRLHIIDRMLRAASSLDGKIKDDKSQIDITPR